MAEVNSAMTMISCERLRLALLLSFGMGQRVSDVLQAEALDVALIRGYVVVTLRYTKTSRKTRPTTIHIPMSFDDLADRIWALATQRRLLGRPFLFLADMNDKTREMASSAISKALVKVNPQLSQRGIRRGGLQAWARAGLPPENLMYLSGHTSQQMLERYLNWGAHMLHQAHKLERFAAKAVDELARTSSDFRSCQPHQFE